MSLTLTNPLRPALLAAARSTRMERTISGSRLTRSLVTKFVPGASQQAAVEAVKALVASGRYISVDHLGEDISHAGEAEQTVAAYLSLLEAYGTLGTGTRPRGPVRSRSRSSSRRWASHCPAVRSSPWSTPGRSVPPPTGSAPG